MAKGKGTFLSPRSRLGFFRGQDCHRSIEIFGVFHGSWRLAKRLACGRDWL
ncbi:MAG: hypothetical protein ACPHL9_00615 [Limisphaerales bacterium]